ncbi:MULTISPECIES: DNA-binding protein [Delftia]|jgi:gp16 family phage-associated protein|nr:MULTISPECIES: DNA-binding protein [Delftia]
MSSLHHNLPRRMLDGKPVAITREDFHRAGVTVSDWAKQHGFSPRLTYEVLRGGRKCLRGQSALIAEALGMK